MGLPVLALGIGFATPNRLEGSRFTRWQLCKMAAGGSRERFYQVFALSLFGCCRPNRLASWVNSKR
jgi:hypothetical protein